MDDKMNERQFLLQSPSPNKVIENAAYATAFVRKCAAAFMRPLCFVRQQPLSVIARLKGVKISAFAGAAKEDNNFLFWFTTKDNLRLLALRIAITDCLNELRDTPFPYNSLAEAHIKQVERLAHSFSSLSLKELAKRIIETGFENGFIFQETVDRFYLPYYHPPSNVSIPDWRIIPFGFRFRILTLKYNPNYQLHCEDGPALVATIQVKGEEEVREWYFLNGVEVTKGIVLTPAEELDPYILIKTANAEVRREIVRKIGIERVCKALDAKVIDRKGDYELLLLDLGDGRRRPYLKMRNPSLGVYHIEGVHPDCSTVVEALRWRNGSELEPEVLA